MWDIKGVINLSPVASYSTFHLNHVGYKGQRGVFLSLGLSYLSSEPCGI